MNKFVFKKVAEFTTEKTELSEVKVDLGLVDNAKALVSLMGEKSREQDLIVKNYVVLEKTLKDNMLTIEQTAQKIQELANTIIKMENELGIKGDGNKFLEYSKNALANAKKQYPL